jgi:hypothetical protein
MPTLMEYLYRAEQCLRLAEDTDQAYAREALLELAAKFQAIAVQLELAVGGRKWGRAGPETHWEGHETFRESQVTRHVARPTLRGLFTTCAVALLDQRSDKAQELLLLWPAAGRDQKGSDVNVGDLAPWGKIGLMPDEHATGLRIAGEQPAIPVGAVVNLSSPNGHQREPLR